MDNDHNYEVSSSQEDVFMNGWTQEFNNDTSLFDGAFLDLGGGEYLNEIQPNQIVAVVDGNDCPPLLDQLFKEEIAETSPPESHMAVIQSAPYVPSSLPASENWAGDYGFSISLDKAAKQQWTYSADLNKLFVVKDAACAINFFTRSPMPGNTFIKAVVLYSSPESVSEVVKRCINHAEEDRKKNIIAADHLIRCDSQTAVYETDPITNHHMVLIPFDNPPMGQSFSTYIFKFTCLGSCPGPARRPLMIVFSLICGDHVVGRVKLNVKICACPKRDRGTEEEKIQQHGSNKKIKPKKKRTASEVESLAGPSVVPQKKVKAPNSDGYYIMKVKDQKCFKFLESMKQYYDIINTIKNLPPDARKVIERYQQRKGYNIDLDQL